MRLILVIIKFSIIHDPHFKNQCLSFFNFLIWFGTNYYTWNTCPIITYNDLPYFSVRKKVVGTIFKPGHNMLDYLFEGLKNIVYITHF